MLEIHEASREYLENVKQFAERTSQSDKLREKLEWLAAYAEHGESGKTKCILYKDFAPNSFGFTMMVRDKIRQAYCLPCEYHFDWEVKMTENTPNIGGEATIWCPKCQKKCHASPQQDSYKRWFEGGLIYHGVGDSGVGFPTLSVRLGDTSESGWSVHT